MDGHWVPPGSSVGLNVGDSVGSFVVGARVGDGVGTTHADEQLPSSPALYAVHHFMAPSPSVGYADTLSKYTSPTSCQLS